MSIRHHVLLHHVQPHRYITATVRYGSIRNAAALHVPQSALRGPMIRIEPALARARFSAQMLLQVDDELIFEVPEDEVEKTMPVITQVMAEAPHPAISLSVPLQVDARAAKNWDEAH